MKIQNKLRYLLTLLAFQLAVLCCYGQQAQFSYDSVANLIRENYNASKPQKIYEMTAAAFRKKMSAEQFAQGMAKFYAKTGTWFTLSFKQSGATGADYLCRFENSSQIVSINLDDQHKVVRLNFDAAPVEIPGKTEKAASNNPLKDTTDLLVEKQVRPFIQKGNTSGLVMAIIDRGTVRKYSYGSVNKDSKQLPDADRTIFEIGSVTKTFNALLLANAVCKERMKLEDPVNQYLPDDIPELKYEGRPITLKQLANHTSGLPRLPQNIFNGNVDPKDPYKHYLTDSLYGFLKTYRMSAAPGLNFSYSNLAAGLLGTILERNTGLTFEQLIETEIAKPLKMNHTGVSLSPAEQKYFAQGYNEKGEATSPWDLASLKGSGAIRSTLADMVRYVQAQLGAKTPLLKAITLSQQTTFTGGKEDMALGWRISRGHQSNYLHHAGGTGGFRSFVGFSKERQYGIIILANAAEDVSAIGEYFLRRQSDIR